MSQINQIPRRTFLKGLGTVIALPMLESFAPTRVLAAGANAASLSRSGYPIRMAFIFVPNGAHMDEWTPSRIGADYQLPSVLQPLASLKNDFNVLSGLTHDKGRANGDGAGDHARSAGVFLTGAQPLKSEGSQIRAGVSVDQYAAQVFARQSRFASLELGTEEGRQSGNCDSGYSCAYSNNISWRNETTPMAKETNPRAVFERLFANEIKKEVLERQGRRENYRKSILDFVLDDARSLRSRVNGNDQQKLDEYLTAVREIERRVERVENMDREVARIVQGAEVPEGIPDGYMEHIRLMGDMMVLAFQTDVTRVCSFMFANAASNKSYRFIGVNEGHHSLSHHQGDPEKLHKISQINQFHIAQLGYILNRLKSVPEGNGSLLDNCMILYGSGISDGNRHNNENLPVLLAGRGGGRILPGRHIRYHEETPMCNLLLSMLNYSGIPARSFGDSTGILRHLAV